MYSYNRVIQFQYHNNTICCNMNKKHLKYKQFPKAGERFWQSGLNNYGMTRQCIGFLKILTINLCHKNRIETSPYPTKILCYFKTNIMCHKQFIAYQNCIHLHSYRQFYPLLLISDSKKANSFPQLCLFF